MSNDELLTRSRGFFTVLAVHREDVAQALAMHGPEEVRNNFDVCDDAMDLANQLSDDDMEYLATKLGDRMMEGADYYETVCELATTMIEFPGVITDESQAAQAEADAGSDGTTSGWLNYEEPVDPEDRWVNPKGDGA